MSCWFGFLYSVSFHNLPFFIQSQKPGSARFLLSVQHRWVDYIIVFKNRFFKLALRGKKFLLREKEEMKVRGRGGSFPVFPLPSCRNSSRMADQAALGHGWPDVPLPIGVNFYQHIMCREGADTLGKKYICTYVWGFPSGASGRKPTCQCQCRRSKKCRFDPWIGKIPWRRKWQPTPVFFPGESHGQRSLVGYSP